MKGTSKMHKTIIYLAGPITGVEDYKERFAKKEARFLNTPEDEPQIVLNPARLLEGLEDEDCMAICLKLVEMANVVVLLEGWEKSPGAIIEALYAWRQGIPVIEDKGDYGKLLRWDTEEHWFKEA